ncbi:Major latex protein, putative [Ricinus communis]|uniref:Major latex protein, putative n=1 Tax=Ricinus communis TaxID=3988 RepID=B9TAD1_RICCO|nr:Major latex protein, putative [Ricinus communis]|eukprot:XP_002535200.1 MLP-like protein 28 [Ricinus communis]
MALSAKLQVDVELKSSAEKFFKLLSKQIHQIPNASPGNIHQVDVHEGDWETAGSVKLWTYTIDGKREIFKEKVEIDEARKIVTMTAVEGHILELCQSYKIIIEAVPKDEGAVAKITTEYEKFKPDDAPPNKYLNFIVYVVKDVDAHLVNA